LATALRSNGKPPGYLRFQKWAVEIINGALPCSSGGGG
jgi:hypothetical protein